MSFLALPCVSDNLGVFYQEKFQDEKERPCEYCQDTNHPRLIASIVIEAVSERDRDKKIPNEIDAVTRSHALKTHFGKVHGKVFCRECRFTWDENFYLAIMHQNGQCST